MVRALGEGGTGRSAWKPAVQRRQAGLRPLGADLLRRVRRAAMQAGPGEDHRGV